MLDGAIIGNPLCIPDSNTCLDEYFADAGEWCGYDFNRPKQFKKDVDPMMEGSLYTFLVEELREEDSSVLTPSSYFSVFNPAHFLSHDKVCLTDLIAAGFVRETTYRGAYQYVGFYERYKQDIESNDLGNEKVWQVTPKGNTLVFLRQVNGDTNEEDDEKAYQGLVLDSA